MVRIFFRALYGLSVVTLPKWYSCGLPSLRATGMRLAFQLDVLTLQFGQREAYENVRCADVG